MLSKDYHWGIAKIAILFLPFLVVLYQPALNAFDTHQKTKRLQSSVSSCELLPNIDKINTCMINIVSSDTFDWIKDKEALSQVVFSKRHSCDVFLAMKISRKEFFSRKVNDVLEKISKGESSGEDLDSVLTTRGQHWDLYNIDFVDYQKCKEMWMQTS